MRKTPDLTGGSGLLHQALAAAAASSVVAHSSKQSPKRTQAKSRPARALTLVAGRSARCFCPAPPGRARSTPPQEHPLGLDRLDPLDRLGLRRGRTTTPTRPPRRRAVCARLSREPSARVLVPARGPGARREPSCGLARPVTPSAVARPFFPRRPGPRPDMPRGHGPSCPGPRGPSPCPRRPRLRVQSDTEPPQGSRSAGA